VGIAGALIDLQPLRTSPQFRRLWCGQVCSGLGSQLALVAVMFQVWQLTHSPAWTGAVGLAQAIPVVGFGLAGGPIADRGDRRRTHLIAVTGQAGCSALLAVQALSGPAVPIEVLALLAVQSGFSAVCGTTSQTFLPRLLSTDQVPAGLALNRISFQTSLLVGPAIGGLVLARLGIGSGYLVDAISFAAAFYGVLGLPSMPARGEPPEPGLMGILTGLSFLTRHRAVRAALLTDLAATLLAMPISLFPALNAQRFGNDPRTLGLFLTAIGAGGMLASALSGIFTRARRPRLVMMTGSAGWGLALALLGLTRSPWLGLACLIMAGAADTVAVVARGTIIQLNTPDALLGRVSAAEQMVGVAGPDLGNLRAGLVATATTPATALLSGGLLSLLAVILIGATSSGPPTTTPPALAI
jgi:predicted MFS family arabinose efflux permease